MKTREIYRAIRFLRNAAFQNTGDRGFKGIASGHTDPVKVIIES